MKSGSYSILFGHKDPSLRLLGNDKYGKNSVLTTRVTKCHGYPGPSWSSVGSLMGPSVRKRGRGNIFPSGWRRMSGCK